MLSDVDILRTFSQKVNDELEIKIDWRDRLRDNYNVRDGNQWLECSVDRQNADGMPLRTVNMVKPIINAVSGFEIQNRSKVKYVPRVLKDEVVGFNDMVQSAVDYIESEANSQFHQSIAFEDMIVCGVGVTDTTIDYDNNPDGEVLVERVFPYFVLWDPAARAKNITDANWVARARIVDKDTINDYIDSNYDADISDPLDLNFGTIDDARFLEYFSTISIAKSLAIIYEYQWRSKVDFYRVQNPLLKFMGFPNDPYTEQVVEFAKTLKEKYGIDPATTKVFSIEKQDFSSLKKAFEALDLPLNYTKHQKFKYYRSVIAGSKVVSKSENFSQTGFSIKFMTGDFSEMMQCYMGIVDDAKDLQRLLNQCVSDYEGFLRTIPKGGVEIEADAVPNMQAFVQTYTKAREVTIYNPGGLAKTRPKISPPAPVGLFDMINYASNAMLEVSGITKDFMGVTDSGLMTATLNRQLVRQGLTTLSSYFDAKKFYTIAQGKLFIDCVKVLAENSEGRLIRVMNEGEAQYMPLLRDGIMAEYDVIVEDVPQTPSEREDTFQKLMELSGMLLNKPNPVDITPLALQYSPLKGEDIKKVTDLMKPPPPQEPDPIAQQVLVAETEYKRASAEKQLAEAKRTGVDTLLKQQELMQGHGMGEANLKKTHAETHLTQAKVMKEMTQDRPQRNPFQRFINN